MKKDPNRQGRQAPASAPVPGVRFPRLAALALAACAALACGAYLAFRVLSGPPAPTLERRPDQNVLLVTATRFAPTRSRPEQAGEDTNMDRLAAAIPHFARAPVTTLPSHRASEPLSTQHGIHDNGGTASPSAPPCRGWSPGVHQQRPSSDVPVDSRFNNGLQITTTTPTSEAGFPRWRDAVAARGSRSAGWLAWAPFDPRPSEPPPPFDASTRMRRTTAKRRMPIQYSSRCSPPPRRLPAPARRW
jgi:hypothetical protein